MFFTVGRNQTVLKVTDLECTNSAKSNCQWDSQEREIVQSVCVAVRDDFPEDVQDWKVGPEGGQGMDGRGQGKTSLAETRP